MENNDLISIIIYILIGVVLALLTREKVTKYYSNFIEKAPIIKKYWYFTIPFIIIFISTLLTVYYYSDPANIQSNITMVSQILAIFFAIYVGYFAFSQVIEGRFNGLIERGERYIRQKQYFRAIENFLEAHQIRPKDVSALMNLIELYIITLQFEKIEGKMKLLKINKVEHSEKIMYIFFKAAEQLYVEHLREAKKEVRDIIKYCQRYPGSINFIAWNFKDIKDSVSFSKISGESSKIFQNLVLYLEKTMDDQKKERFEGGNYTLE